MLVFSLLFLLIQCRISAHAAVSSTVTSGFYLTWGLSPRSCPAGSNIHHIHDNLGLRKTSRKPGRILLRERSHSEKAPSVTPTIQYSDEDRNLETAKGQWSPGAGGHASAVELGTVKYYTWHLHEGCTLLDSLLKSIGLRESKPEWAWWKLGTAVNIM